MRAEAWPPSRERLVELRQAGHTASSVGALFGVDQKKVEALSERYGVRRTDLDYTALDSRIKELHSQGRARTDIALVLDLPIQTIHQRCFSLQLPDKRRGKPTRQTNLPSVWPPPNEDLHQLLVVEKWPITDVARHYGQRPGMISRHSLRIGVRGAKDSKTVSTERQAPPDTRRCCRCQKSFKPRSRWIFACDPCKRSDEWRAAF